MRLLLAILLFLNALVYSQTGPNSPTSFSTNSSSGSFDWNNSGNISSSEDSYSSVPLNSNGDNSYYLTATDFGFNIPITDNIDGILVEIERSETTGEGNIKDDIIKIIKGGSISGTDHSIGANWPNIDTYKSYGTSVDLWGLTWTPTDINSNNFGIAISTKRTGPGVNNEAKIDHIRITIYHSSSLPIDLLVFAGYKVEKTIRLDWTTASETNNDYFSIEKSEDGINFYEIDQVEGSGNNNGLKHYSSIDLYPHRGNNYYRLTQIDFDGKSESSKIISIYYGTEENSGMVIYPNPNNGNFSIDLPEGEEILVLVMDEEGRVNYSKVIPSITNSTIMVDLEGRLAPGVYFVIASSRRDFFSSRIIIK